MLGTADRELMCALSPRTWRACNSLATCPACAAPAGQKYTGCMPYAHVLQASAEACCAACRAAALHGTSSKTASTSSNLHGQECNAWAFCLDDAKCGSKFKDGSGSGTAAGNSAGPFVRRCHLRRVPNPTRPELRSSGGVPWTSGVVVLPISADAGQPSAAASAGGGSGSTSVREMFAARGLDLVHAASAGLLLGFRSTTLTLEVLSPQVMLGSWWMRVCFGLMIVLTCPTHGFANNTRTAVTMSRKTRPSPSRCRTIAQR